ncbi:hypothetical protein FXF50_17965 [Micromonospora sp. AP08]|uniref:PD40 domain-containing protein n=1 Tax=Micromonospora sp. AP08 TaxID=2604467 RepID=UPI0011D993D5|nr:PD40 domain-containing protein [Micromonospora sp. AP08]TYB36914.1 hypothetical protein FXF50_17965 [Micromonospora sp. AP08]
MNQDRLRLDLAGLAEEVTPVDLRDRALRTSRRLGIQRAVATSAAALVVLAAATGTALAIRPNGSAHTPAPAGPSVTSTWPPVEVTPTPEASDSASPTSSPVKPASALPGTRYYLENTSSKIRIHAVRDDSDRVVHQLPIDLPYSCEASTLTVSPDGKRLAWVQDSTDGNASGILLAGTPGEPGATTLLEDVNCLGPRALVWQGSDLLMVGKKSGQSVLFDVAANKRVNGDPGQETDRCWSADGRWLAAVADGKPYVTDGTQSRQYTYTPPQDEAAHWGGWQARSVSLDGRYVSVGWVGTDPSRHDDSFAVVDTTTSKVVHLPGKGQISSILFTIDEKVIVKRKNGITVLDTNFRPLGTVTESASVRNMALLAYVP